MEVRCGGDLRGAAPFRQRHREEGAEAREPRGTTWQRTTGPSEARGGEGDRDPADQGGGERIEGLRGANRGESGVERSREGREGRGGRGRAKEGRGTSAPGRGEGAGCAD